MVNKMVLGDRFRVEIDGKNLHGQSRKEIAYEYFARRYDGEKKVAESMVWFLFAALAGIAAILMGSIFGLLALAIMVIAIIVGVSEHRGAVEFAFEGVDWGTKNMVRIDK